MTITHDREAPDPMSMSQAERTTRVDLAAAYRLAAMFGWDDLIFTHMTARIPGTEHLLINPYGLLFDEITASNLVKIDLAGRILDDTPHDINPAGLTIHSAVHEAREDVQCVIHLHTTEGVAVESADARRVADLPALDLRVVEHRLSRLRRCGAARRREATAHVELRRQHVPDAAQPRPAHRGQVGGRCVAGDVLLPEVVRDPGRRDRLLGRRRRPSHHDRPVDHRHRGASRRGRSTRGERANLVWPSLLRRVERLDPTFAQ